MVERIKQMWEKHEACPVPMGFRGVVVDGLNLTVLRSDIAANILTYINNGGRLTPNRVYWLQERSQTLTKSIEVLNGDAKSYFSELKSISDMVVKSVQ